MTTLLDTHILLWLLEGDDNLSSAQIQYLERQALKKGLMISSISFWEIAMLAAKGRIALNCDAMEWRRRALDRAGLEEITVDGLIAVQAVLLPDPFHADPADRLIVGTARTHSLEIATADRKILDYGRLGHVATWTV